MKKILLGSTAVLGFAMMASQAQAEVDLSFGAEVNVFGGFVSDDMDNERDYGIVNEAEFDIMLDGQADNGLLYGASMTVEASGGNAAFDESFLYIGGDWGEFRAGNHDGAAHAFRLTVPDAGSGAADGDFDAFTGSTPHPGTGFVAGGNKISYHGQFGDVGFGVSYTPSVGNGASGSGAGLNVPDDLGADVISAGVEYNGDFGGTTLGLSAGANYGMSEGDVLERVAEAGLGAEVGFAGFTVGGFYVNSFDSYYPQANTGTSSNWRAGLGLGYQMGALNVALNGLYEEMDPGDPTGNLDTESDTWAVGLGADYALAPGLTTYGDLTYFDYDGPGNTGNDGIVFLVGTTVNF